MKRCIALLLFVLLLMIAGACGRQPELSPVAQTSSVTENLSVAGTPSVAETPSATESPNDVPQIETMRPQSVSESPAEAESREDDNGMTSIAITVGGSVFSAKLYDNDTVTAFLGRFPMTLDMSELNGNEKYYYLPESLPTDSVRVGSVNAGDLMLYGSVCLVLFYESFSTAYSYTRLGFIESTSGLANALGRGNAEVTFAVSE